GGFLGSSLTQLLGHGPVGFRLLQGLLLFLFYLGKIANGTVVNIDHFAVIGIFQVESVEVTCYAVLRKEAGLSAPYIADEGVLVRAVVAIGCLVIDAEEAIVAIFAADGHINVQLARID